MLKLTKPIALTIAIFVAVSSSADAHQWTIDGKQVNAKAVDVNSTHVLLEDSNGYRKAVALNRLVERDMERLSNMVNVASAKQQLRFQKEQLKAQRISNMSEYSSTWNVRMVAPNGTSGTRTYFADNSLAATRMARRDFPNAQVMNVAKRRTKFAGERFNIPRFVAWRTSLGGLAVPFVSR
jgi:hypothetical protein